MKNKIKAKTDAPKAVLITATSSGIGAACAKELTQKGYWVFAGLRDLTKAEALQEATDGKLTPIQIDVTNLDIIASAVEQITEMLAKENAKLVGVVNNATNERHGPLEILPFEFIREEIEVDYLGSVAVIQAFLPLLRESQGRIINFSSMNGRCVFRSIGANSAAKFAIEAMSDALRLELAPWGIDVSLIEPGAVVTPLWDKALHKFEDLPNHVRAEKLELYYPSWSEAVKQAKEDQARFLRSAMPVERVVQTIFHALTSNKPKARYIVGSDARFFITLKWLLPDRWFDKVANIAFNDQ